MNFDENNQVRDKLYLAIGLRILILLILLILVLVIGYLQSQPGRLDPISQQTSEGVSEGEIQTEISVVTPLSPLIPIRLTIPKLDLDTTFVAPLGLSTGGEVSVPDSYTEVGWYQNSPTPGEVGPAVVLGHVDSYQGPAVFFSLGQLAVGDDIFITKEDGSVAHFRVSALERYEQENFPTEKVYGDIDYAGLRLITCTGTYFKGQQRYSHNLVVYADLVEQKSLEAI